MHPLPAHQTKHLPTLTYPFNGCTFHFAQSSDGISNGTALWLGAQVLSAYAASELNAIRLSNQRRPKAVELGSGIGLTALALSTLGYEVLATDTSHVCNSILRRNISTNLRHLPDSAGPVQVRVLDWHVPSDAWNWHDPLQIASHARSSEVSRVVPDEGILRPPFDLILSSDTLYDASLIDPFFSTLKSLCLQGRDSTSSTPPKYPLVILALERRDPELISTALARAPIQLTRVPVKKLRKALERVGIQWRVTDWDGVEIWKGIGRP
ncbi:hypothetical protein V8B97DRAFT_1915192 [Scleroderma yunnanense]